MPVDVAQAFFGKHFSVDENGARQKMRLAMKFSVE